jgi:hypothetical protein
MYFKRQQRKGSLLHQSQTLSNISKGGQLAGETEKDPMLLISQKL